MVVEWKKISNFSLIKTTKSFGNRAKKEILSFINKNLSESYSVMVKNQIT